MPARSKRYRSKKETHARKGAPNGRRTSGATRRIGERGLAGGGESLGQPMKGEALQMVHGGPMHEDGMSRKA